MAKVSIIPEDYDALKKEYLSLKKQLEEVNQELYDCQRQLKVREALEKDYQSEIDMYQNEEIRQKQKYQETILNLEETINKMRTAHSEQIITLETDLMKMEEKYESLEAEVDIMRKSNTDISFSGDTSKLIEEILSLKGENHSFSKNHEEVMSDLKDLQERNTELERCLVECRMEISNLQESLNCKRDELAETISLKLKLTDEILCLKSELESYRSKPLDEMSKGNSLFAEVDDRRVYLQDTINKMKADYIAMKQERSRNLNTLHQLKLENARLLNRYKAEKSEKEEDEYEVINSLKCRITTLEDTVARCRRELESKPVVLYKSNYEEIKYYEEVLKSKNKEIKELEEQLSSKTLTRILLSASLKEANEEKRRWHLEATMKQNQLDLRDIEEKRKTEEKDAETDNFQKPEKPKRESEQMVAKKEMRWKEIRGKVLETDNYQTTERCPTVLGEEKDKRNSETLEDKKPLRWKDIRKRNSEEANVRGDATFRTSGSDSYRKSLQDSILKEIKECVEQNLAAVDEVDTKTEEIIVIDDDDDQVDDCSSRISLGKENNPGTSTQPVIEMKQPKKATFSADTVSPKKITRAGGRLCKVLVSKPVYMSCIPPSD